MEPWNLRTDDARTANALKTFIIFCEGDVSEPLYFRYFETPHIKVNPIPNQNSKLQHVQKAMKYCFDNKVFVYKDALPIVEQQNVNLWCVYDRDVDNTSVDKIQEGNLAFDSSLVIAEKNGMNLAWSNDSFELWILLHFEDVDPNVAANELRSQYYKRLSEILAEVETPGEDLSKLLGLSNFNYKAHCKGRDNFLNIVRKMMLPNTQIAIERAGALVNHHNQTAKPAHQKTPCTLVHLLVQELLEHGGKVLPENK